MEQKQKSRTTQDIDPYILRRFIVQEKIGSGAYGHVWKVEHIKTKKQYALKKIFEAFQNATDAQRTFREVAVLRQLNHENIIRLVQIFRAENQLDLYLLFEHMSADLHSAIRQSILSPSHKMFLTYQIAKALKYLHSAELLHRDLKPSNILLNQDCQSKLCDFGLVRFLASPEETETAAVLTEHVATRWYRSPEILLGKRDYSKETDIWSFGCILAEMMVGRPMFQGKSTLEQLEKVLGFTGVPGTQQMREMGYDEVEEIVKSVQIQRVNKEELFKGQDPHAVDLVMKCLRFNPKQRPTAEEIVLHPYVEGFRIPSEEITCPLPIFSPVNDNQKFSIQEYRNILFKMADMDREKYRPQRSQKQNYSKHEEGTLATMQPNIRRRKIANSMTKKHRQSITEFLQPYLKENRFVKKSIHGINVDFLKQVQHSKSTHSVHKKISTACLVYRNNNGQRQISNLIKKRFTKDLT